MQRSLHFRPGLGAALCIVQHNGRPLRRVRVDFPALIHVQSGTKTIRVGERRIIAQRGEILAVEAGAEIEVINTPPSRGAYEAICLAFAPELCRAYDNPAAATHRISPAVTLRDPARHLLSAVQRAVGSLQAAPGEPEAILRHQLHEVLLSLELLGWRFEVGHLNLPSVRVRRLISSDPARRWKAGAVARALGLSEATLRRRLEREQLTFRAILNEVRMGHALTLLQSSELSVLQIAAAVGYESVSQFAARFRRHFGQSPRTLRVPSTTR